MQLQIEWVKIDQGEFIAGTDLSVDKVAAASDWAIKTEQPQHIVFLPTFEISRTLVTQKMWSEFIEHTGYEWADRNRAWPDGLTVDMYKLPATWVTWHDARSFCEWANVRLPSEAEWEKAARGSNGQVYPWGDTVPDESLANFNQLVGHANEVDRYEKGKRPYGIYDMAGNVFEWTNTIWGSKKDNPEFGHPYSANDGREETDDLKIMRVVKGGGWKYSHDLIRAAYRDWNEPQFRGSCLGFRVAR
ncbi:MAG: formylglycine-generating enzyme family protein [Spirochaetota bacterium]